MKTLLLALLLSSELLASGMFYEQPGTLEPVSRDAWHFAVGYFPEISSLSARQDLLNDERLDRTTLKRYVEISSNKQVTSTLSFEAGKGGLHAGFTYGKGLDMGGNWEALIALAEIFSHREVNSSNGLAVARAALRFHGLLITQEKGEYGEGNARVMLRDTQGTYSQEENMHYQTMYLRTRLSYRTAQRATKYEMDRGTFATTFLERRQTKVPKFLYLTGAVDSSVVVFGTSKLLGGWSDMLLGGLQVESSFYPEALGQSGKVSTFLSFAGGFAVGFGKGSLDEEDGKEVVPGYRLSLDNCGWGASQGVLELQASLMIGRQVLVGRSSSVTFSAEAYGEWAKTTSPEVFVENVETGETWVPNMDTWEFRLGARGSLMYSF